MDVISINDFADTGEKFCVIPENVLREVQRLGAQDDSAIGGGLHAFNACMLTMM
jgi:hypothetical protein